MAHSIRLEKLFHVRQIKKIPFFVSDHLLKGGNCELRIKGNLKIDKKSDFERADGVDCHLTQLIEQSDQNIHHFLTTILLLDGS